MSAAITAAVIAVVGAAGSAAASSQQAKKQNKRINAQNAQQLGLDVAARGAPLNDASAPASVQGVEAAFLPYYMDGEEAALGRYAARISKAIREQGGTPEEQLAKYESMLAAYDPAMDMADQAVLDEVTGEATRQELEFSKPVFEARTGVANAKRNAGLEALKETLNEIDQIQAGKGYSGDSTGKRMLRFNARRAIGTESAKDLAEANLENASERRVIESTGRDRRAAGGAKIASLFNQRIARNRLPALAVSEDFNASFAPLKNFNIGTNEFTTPQSYVDGPDMIGALSSSIGGTLTNFFGKKAADNRDSDRRRMGLGEVEKQDDSGD